MPKMIQDAITLKCGDWECDIYPAIAANAVRLEWKGQPVLRTLPSREAWDGFPCVYGTPALIPANRTADGKFTFEGVTYQMEVNEKRPNNQIHGRMHSRAFTVLKQTETYTLCHYDSTPDVYPFPFAADFSAELTEAGLHQEFKFTNTGDKNMPMTFAVHTSFAEPESFAVPLGRRWVTNDRSLPTGEIVDLTEEEKQWCVNGISEGVKVNGYFLANGHTARVGDFAYTVSENFDQWVLYNCNGTGKHFCAEPQCGPVNGLNMENGYRVLRPGESITFVTMISRLAK